MRKIQSLMMLGISYLVYMLLLAGFSRIETETAVVKPLDVQEEKRVSLTFDDGPGIYTDKLLDGLKKRNVRAAFFVIGEQAEKMPDIVKREYREGHLVGNHTYHHVEIARVDEATAEKEIEMTNTLLESLTGQKTEYVRPPFGSWQKNLEEKLDMIPVLWTVDPLDWTTKNVDEIVNKVVTDVKENDIILLHDCYDSSVQAALRIVDLLQAKGYQFVTPDELLLN